MTPIIKHSGTYWQIYRVGDRRSYNYKCYLPDAVRVSRFKRFVNEENIEILLICDENTGH